MDEEQKGNEKKLNVSDILTKFAKPRTILLTIMAAALLSLLISVICLVSVNKTNASVNTLATEVQALSASNSDLSSKIESLEATVGNTQDTLLQDAATKYLQITKQPTSVTTTLGRTDAMLFSVQVTANSSSMSFAWEIQDSSGNWKEILFDDQSLNTSYGLRLYNDIASGESQLWAKDLTASAASSYRCKISDSAGTYVYTDTVVVELH